MSPFAARAGWFLVAAAVAILGAATASAQQKPPMALKMGNTSASAVYWTGYIARAKGFFAGEGLEVEDFIVGNPAQVAQQVIGGSLDLGVVTYETLVRARREDAPIVGIAGIMVRYAYAFMVSPNIKRAADLRGKKVMLPLPRQLLTQAFENFIAKDGLTPTDVDEVFNGSSANRFAALAAGVADGAYLTAPFDMRAVEQGARKLFDLATFYPDAGAALIVGRKDWLDANPERARATLRAFGKATAWLYDPANRAEAEKILMVNTQVDAGIATKIYDYLIGELKPYAADMRIPPASMQRTIDLLIQIGDVKAPGPRPEDYIDPRFYP